MKQPIITLSSDFGIQSQGIGNMEGVIAQIAPNTRVIHLMHGIPNFDIRTAARTMEVVNFMPVGFHVCIVDPGVGTKRRAIIIQVERGDYLIGPDNGVLISAVNILGGAKKIVEITNPKYMIKPVSPIFHGRHIFAPAAAYLSNGVPIEEFGPRLEFDQLVSAPYSEATIKDDIINSEVININKFGSLNLNILHSTWDKLNLSSHQIVQVTFKGKTISLPFVETFGAVEEGKPVILKDDYGRVEIAINLGDFAKKYNIRVGDFFVIKKL
ncbi:SAM-dependent chlorinase/fluorinase [Candidatus Daviesbacteria bacterium]|nr:SAM-dependent chlorinase/fluorinase [Candidatus Daviesbacteria bacterium]